MATWPLCIAVAVLIGLYHENQPIESAWAAAFTVCGVLGVAVGISEATAGRRSTLT